MLTGDVFIASAAAGYTVPVKARVAFIGLCADTVTTGTVNMVPFLVSGAVGDVLAVGDTLTEGSVPLEAGGTGCVLDAYGFAVAVVGVLGVAGIAAFFGAFTGASFVVPVLSVEAVGVVVLGGAGAAADGVIVIPDCGVGAVNGADALALAGVAVVVGDG